jgi:hypothetical protein
MIVGNRRWECLDEQTTDHRSLESVGNRGTTKMDVSPALCLADR